MGPSSRSAVLTANNSNQSTEKTQTREKTFKAEVELHLDGDKVCWWDKSVAELWSSPRS